jgi:hypothetical protein
MLLSIVKRRIDRKLNRVKSPAEAGLWNSWSGYLLAGLTGVLSRRRRVGLT